MKILVVDDEPGLRQTLTRILGAEGHATITAGDGEEALERLATDDVDLVLCDLRMPGMSGLEYDREVHGRAGAARSSWP